MLSAWLAQRAAGDNHYRTWALAIVNLVLPAIALASAARGQNLQGVRYFAWALIFMIVWNLQLISAASISSGDSTRGVEARKPMQSAAWLALMVMAGFTWWFEGSAVRRISQGRSATFLEMRAQPFGELAGKRGVAYDIGFIAYFSRADICDVNGLVGGRDFAATSEERRIEVCSSSSPVFAFVTPGQAQELADHTNLDSWIVCHDYWFPNFNPLIPKHYLLVKPESAQSLCPPPWRAYGKGGTVLK
jgi:hypothetical protein